MKKLHFLLITLITLVCSVNTFANNISTDTMDEIRKIGIKIIKSKLDCPTTFSLIDDNYNKTEKADFWVSYHEEEDTFYTYYRYDLYLKEIFVNDNKTDSIKRPLGVRFKIFEDDLGVYCTDTSFFKGFYTIYHYVKREKITFHHKAPSYYSMYISYVAQVLAGGLKRGGGGENLFILIV